jgi:hypothetical protein
MWDRITGKVEVVDARTLRFADGKRVELNTEAPDLNQMALAGDAFYPCGREAAEFLRDLIGDRPVTCYMMTENTGVCYVGDTNVIHALIVNGWAMAGHSSQHPAEVIARENKRGLWRGPFLPPDEWREGKRLPGEEAARKKLEEKKPADKPPAIVGTWRVTAFHTTQAGLFQLVWGARKRGSEVRFEQVGDRLTGHAMSTDFDDKTEPIVFRTLRFTGDRLVFEFDTKGWAPGVGPLAVESGQVPNKGMLRAEARLTGDRPVGTRGLSTADGAEVFRGEWSAVRAKETGKR